ncbi:hypothetical protein [Streptomyces sp. AA1529]|uniref:hypothetical protein n=1 Tax=Streptomyces sp. AA1529 TaxID=1203257 RepID=UPI00031E6503|nr:hypothetical protein [Streptomyces sp. AA1529]
MKPPMWTSTSTIPPGAAALQELAEKAVGPGDADEVAYRLYDQIRGEQARVSGLEDTRRELYACRAILRTIQQFTNERLDRDDDTARRIYATIARFNYGDMYRPGGSLDRYLIPAELTNEDGAA